MADAGSVDVKFGAETKGIEDGVRRATRSIQEFREQVNSAAERLLKFGEAALIGGAIKEVTERIAEFVKGMAELGNETEDTAAILGVATERIGELQAIAMGSGDSLQSVSLGMERLAYNMQKAAGGSKIEQDAFDRLGVSLYDSQGRMKDVNEVLNEMADSFQKHADGGEKVALAMQLMGRSGARLIPILDQGREGFARWEEMARRTGTTLSEAVVRGMVEVQGSLVEVTLAFQGLGVQIFNSFQPAINGVLKTVAGLIERFTDWINQSYSTGGAMRALALMVDVVVSAIMTLISAFELLWDVASGIVDSLSQSLGSLGKEIAFVLSGNFSAAGAEATAAANAIKGTWVRVGSDMGKILGEYKDNIKAMWDATLNPPAQISVPYGGPGGGGKSPYAAPTDFATEKAKIDQLKSALKDVQQQFESVFKGIISGFDKAISGLVSGTMTWKEAMFSVIDSIWSMLVKMGEDWVAQWLANEATMLVAHQTANAEKIASDQIANSTSATDMIMNAIKAIFASSKQTAAGVTANLSPTLGPLAIPAGLAAGATVAGMASFDVGAWELPKDQVAQVHKGEMIVPAAGGAADMIRELLAGGGGRGGDTHIHNWNGPVLDKEGLARTVVGVMNRNPSIRGKW